MLFGEGFPYLAMVEILQSYPRSRGRSGSLPKSNNLQAETSLTFPKKIQSNKSVIFA